MEISELGELNAKYDYDITYLSRLCGLNAEHSSLCGKIIEEGVSKALRLCVFSVRAFHIYQDSPHPGLRLTHI